MTGGEFDWLEGSDKASAADALIPTHGLTKRELSAATGLSLKAIDKLCRDGAPARSTGSKRGGLHFDLPIFIEWYAAHRAAERGGDGTSYSDARTKAMLAIAQKRNLEGRKLAGELIPMTEAYGLIDRLTSEIRTGLQAMPSQLPMLSEQHRRDLEQAIRDLMTTVSEKESSED